MLHTRWPPSPRVLAGFELFLAQHMTYPFFLFFYSSSSPGIPPGVFAVPRCPLTSGLGVRVVCSAGLRRPYHGKRLWTMMGFRNCYSTLPGS